MNREKFKLFGPISCDRAKELWGWGEEGHLGPCGLMSLGTHLEMPAEEHEDGCPALLPVARIKYADWQAKL